MEGHCRDSEVLRMLKQNMSAGIASGALNIATMETIKKRHEVADVVEVSTRWEAMVNGGRRMKAWRILHGRR